MARVRAPMHGLAWRFVLFSLFSTAALALVPAAWAVPAKVQGRIVATDTGEPIGYADVALLPADTTQRRVAGYANADGTFQFEAAAGVYALQIRALSYETKRFENVILEDGKLTPFEVALRPEALEQEEIVVEADAILNTEAALLAARRKASVVGDAVSAEQVRKSADADAAEVLRRVTALSVTDGKYVFVRGLGERYSSTEIDGVRVASPEENRRVVPLDLVPANLLENVVVQKTYTADRPGEFGGGDVQVKTKDFPGTRSWSIAVAQGYSENATFENLNTYPGTGADAFGFGADFRKMPDAVFDIAGDRPLFLSNDPARGFTKGTLAEIGKSFYNAWTPSGSRAPPNSGYSAAYGDQYEIFERPLGVVVASTFSRGFEYREESQRFFQGVSDTLYDYDVQRATQTTQLGLLGGVSYRLSPAHTLHLRGLWTHGSDDEVRMYEGPDHNRIEATTGDWLVHRNTRLLYVQRSILSGSLEGRHDFPSLWKSGFEWKLTRSLAKRQQPDRRETTYDRRYYTDGNGDLIGAWVLGSPGRREYGDLDDDGWGVTLQTSTPYRLGHLGNGKVAVGYDHQRKDRVNSYRRLDFLRNQSSDPSTVPESLFTIGAFDGSGTSAYVEEKTLSQDNYEAEQRLHAGFVSADVPFGARLRATLGLRVEYGMQDVRSYDLFDPTRTTARGGFEETDLLPSANLTYAPGERVNVRLAASRTLSRPDLNELSPRPALEYVGGFQQSGNPDLTRAVIYNYDARVEVFPSLSEVLAAGVFHKRLHEPIEQTIQGGSPPVLVPRNSDYGDNYGVELEARAALSRIWGGFDRFFLNTNAAFINSTVYLKPQLSELGSAQHPLQGQAAYIVNGTLSYTTPGGAIDASVLVTYAGERLRALGLSLPDIYEQPNGTLDFAVNWKPVRGLRLKLAAKNLLNPEIRRLQGDREVSSYQAGRRVALGLSYGL